MASKSETVDIFISGAGPVGLFFAYQMVQLGHSIYICDPKEGPTDQSRAVLLTPRTMEVMENRKIAHHLLKEAICVQGIQVHVHGSKVGTIDVAAGDTSFPQMTCLAQEKTEAVLIKLLGEERISWHTRLVDYTQREDDIEAIVKHTETDQETKIYARYIIGADGSHSVARKRNSGWEYEGFAIATKFGMADVALSGKDADKVMNNRANGFIHADGMCGVIPIGKRPNGRYYFRVVSNLGPYEIDKDKRETTHGIHQEEPFTLEELQAVMDKRLHPLEIIANDPVWITQFRINERKANGFRRDRAFLIGGICFYYAAHCHSPVGGQGLNLGFQDADNLAWKLSLALQGLSSDPEKLLDSYSIEREPIAKGTLQSTGSTTRIGLTSGPILSTVGYVVLSGALSFDYLKNYVITNMMQIYLRIPKESPLLPPASKVTKGMIEPGQFMLDTGVLRKRVITDDLERRTIHQILRSNSGQHAVIWIGSRPSRVPACPWTSDYWKKFMSNNYAAARPIVIESTWHTHENSIPDYVDKSQRDIAESAFWAEDRWDAYDSVSKRVGLADRLRDKEIPAAIVVVRPDLYVAFSCLVKSPKYIDIAFEYLDGYLKAMNADI